MTCLELPTGKNVHIDKKMPELDLVRSTYKINAALVFPWIGFLRAVALQMEITLIMN